LPAPLGAPTQPASTRYVGKPPLMLDRSSHSVRADYLNTWGCPMRTILVPPSVSEGRKHVVTVSPYSYEAEIGGSFKNLNFNTLLLANLRTNPARPVSACAAPVSPGRRGTPGAARAPSAASYCSTIPVPNLTRSKRRVNRARLPCTTR